MLDSNSSKTEAKTAHRHKTIIANFLCKSDLTIFLEAKHETEIVIYVLSNYIYIYIYLFIIVLVITKKVVADKVDGFAEKKEIHYIDVETDIA